MPSRQYANAQGLLSTMRVFEYSASLLHVGPNGELYRPGEESMTVNPTPLDQSTKMAALAHFQTRAEAVLHG